MIFYTMLCVAVETVETSNCHGNNLATAEGSNNPLAKSLILHSLEIIEQNNRKIKSVIYHVFALSYDYMLYNLVSFLTGKGMKHSHWHI